MPCFTLNTHKYPHTPSAPPCPLWPVALSGLHVFNRPLGLELAPIPCNTFPPALIAFHLTHAITKIASSKNKPRNIQGCLASRMGFWPRNLRPPGLSWEAQEEAGMLVNLPLP